MWAIGREPETGGMLARVSPGTWIVRAVASDEEVRRWRVSGRRAATSLVDDVALALRTGAEGPAGELPPEPDTPQDGTHDDERPGSEHP